MIADTIEKLDDIFEKMSIEELHGISYILGPWESELESIRLQGFSDEFIARRNMARVIAKTRAGVRIKKK